MKVELIAATTVLDYQVEQYMDTGTSSFDSADIIAEFSGRACYQSFHKPNPKTRQNRDYLANILGQGHESVLEHASATFYVQGVSRSLTHELIRHRHLSFSELSQRFVNMDDPSYIVPPALRELGSQGHYMFQDAMYAGDSDWYAGIVDVLKENGYTRKQAREAARAIMPNATETKIVVTGNMRAWRDVIKKRWHVAADAEIQEFAGEILTHLRDIAPASVQDIPEQPYGSD